MFANKRAVNKPALGDVMGGAENNKTITSAILALAKAHLFLRHRVYYHRPAEEKKKTKTHRQENDKRYANISTELSKKRFAIAFHRSFERALRFHRNVTWVVVDDDDDFPSQHLQGRVFERRADRFRSNFVDLVGDGTSHLLYHVPSATFRGTLYFARRSCVRNVVFVFFFKPLD